MFQRLNTEGYQRQSPLNSVNMSDSHKNSRTVFQNKISFWKFDGGQAKVILTNFLMRDTKRQI